ncbi:maltose ABC transporter ATP-binding protein /trehalose ABC transporter ATP-binding protein [Cribrihabitans marinus]|uniref:Maltose ABC transporter ATP-binding protein /trehalose ABC transporter ATP-binding protein n=1 Tax=Cribrihabitans marinus TaxID=1227549 RepID=A0A1H7E9B6_9RHOB|nr:ABC transporter ATP-binding protein [Cribrihabitans marinus]GGH42080.1 sugar ABC transporter ATP-binding protein [Cribrihabitans marinus]SEK08240.1 maltose ABC transporter ATP-binding protein /trehalose ABC transporter ATP-binding protein [Cribrihabitans marinus]
MSDIRISDLNKSFGATQVLKNINLDIRSGEFIVFVGPSGCGKSTLLRAISGLESITSGTLEIGGARMNDVQPAKRGIAMVFQTYALYPHMTVADNMAYSLRLNKTPKAERDRMVKVAADMLHLTDYLGRKPKELSGGQRQRVAIGRAIVRDPKVFLFDEPLSNLDAALRLKMRLEISRIHGELPGTTMIYVTHDQVEAMTMADRIVVLKDGEIQQVGAPIQLYEKPASLFVAQFIGSPKMNVMTGRHAEKFKAAHVGVRPEHLEITNDGVWSGEVIHAENLGSDSFVYIDIGEDEPLAVRQSGTAGVAPGTRLSVAPIRRQYHLFDAAGRPQAV